MTQQYETRKTICISTGHLPEEEMSYIENNPDECSLIFNSDYGVLLTLNWDFDPVLEDNAPQFVKVIDWALKEGADWLNLDCDAPTVDALPTYEW